MRAATAVAAVAVATVVAGVVGGCGGGSKPAASVSPNPATAELMSLASASTTTTFTATYAAKLVDGKSGVIAVYVDSPTRYRVDVTLDKLTASLYGTAQGAIACSIAAGVTPVCYLAALPGQPIPAVAEAGVERVFLKDLPTLASLPPSFTVTAKDPIALAGKLPAAKCFAVTSQRGTNLFTSGLLDDIDLGTYCLAENSPPRRLEFASGSLDLVSVGGVPTAAQLTPPAAPQPLPSPTATPSSTGTTAPPLGLLSSASPAGSN
jgi:hypothetical protein